MSPSASAQSDTTSPSLHLTSQHPPTFRASTRGCRCNGFSALRGLIGTTARFTRARADPSWYSDRASTAECRYYRARGDADRSGHLHDRAAQTLASDGELRVKSGRRILPDPDVIDTGFNDPSLRL